LIARQAIVANYVRGHFRNTGWTLFEQIGCYLLAVTLKLQRFYDRLAALQREQAVNISLQFVNIIWRVGVSFS
jgi:hypothetical protein